MLSAFFGYASRPITSAMVHLLADHPEEWELHFTGAFSPAGFGPEKTQALLVQYMGASKSLFDSSRESVAIGSCVAIVFSALGLLRELKFEKSRMADKTD